MANLLGLRTHQRFSKLMEVILRFLVTIDTPSIVGVAQSGRTGMAMRKSPVLCFERALCVVFQALKFIDVVAVVVSDPLQCWMLVLSRWR